MLKPFLNSTQPKPISKDAQVAKNIIDLLFINIDTNIKNDRKMNGFTKSLIMGQLPKIRDGSKDYVNDMPAFAVKTLLDSIQSELNKRK